VAERVQDVTQQELVQRPDELPRVQRVAEVDVDHPTQRLDPDVGVGARSDPSAVVVDARDPRATGAGLATAGARSEEDVALGEDGPQLMGGQKARLAQRVAHPSCAGAWSGVTHSIASTR
jgi:hypothetical protein